MQYHPTIIRALKEFHKATIPVSPPKRLALLNKFRKTFHAPDFLQGFDILFIQHHLGPFIPKIRAMIKDGLNIKRTWIVDVPYSTNLDVRDEIANMGVLDAHRAKLFDDPLAPYSDNQIKRTNKILQGIANRKNPRPLLVMDDGAYFARSLHKLGKADPELAGEFVNSHVVEQTTRGQRYFEEEGKHLIASFNLKVVSIARCYSKLNFESPFIGAAIAKAVTKKIEKMDGFIERLKNILIIGFGAVGRATTLELQQISPQVRIDVIDTDVTKRKQIRSTGSNVKALAEFPEKLPKEKLYDLVVGCTGYGSFKLHHHSLLADNALLASGSSAAIEFNRERFIEKADEFPDDEIKVLNRKKTKKDGIRASIEFQQSKGRIFTFLNAGFPINFTGEMECLPTRVIQSTHTLLFAAAHQASKMRKPGFKRIKRKFDCWIFDNSINELDRKRNN